MDIVNLLNQVSVYLGDTEHDRQDGAQYNTHYNTPYDTPYDFNYNIQYRNYSKYNTLYSYTSRLPSEYSFIWIGSYIVNPVTREHVACVSTSYYDDHVHVIHGNYVYMICELYKESVIYWLEHLT